MRGWAQRLKAIHRLVARFALVASVSLLATGLAIADEHLCGVGVLLLLLAAYSPGDGLLLLGPFARWELVRAAKRGWLFLFRSVLIVFGFFLVKLIFLDSVSGAIFETGQDLALISRLAEQSFTILNFIVIMLAVLFGLFQLPSIITEEKEAKRIEHLLVTDLRNHELLIGKLFGRFAILLMYVLALVPVSMTIVVHGGVDPNFVVASALILVLTYFGIAGLSIAASTLFARGTSAVVFTLFVYGAYQLFCHYGIETLGIFSRRPLVESAIVNGSLIHLYKETISNMDTFATVSWLLRSYALHQLFVVTFGMLVGVAGVRPAERRTRNLKWEALATWRLVMPKVGVGYMILLALAVIACVGLWVFTQFGDRILPSSIDVLFEQVLTLLPLVYLAAFSVAVTHFLGKPTIPQTIHYPLFWRETSRRPLGFFRFTRYFGMLNWLIPCALILWFGIEGDSRRVRWVSQVVADNFPLFGFLACGWLVLPAMWNASRSIVQERQFDTLDALLLTDLEPRYIVREKWLAAFWHGRRRWVCFVLLLIASLVLSHQYLEAALGLFVTTLSSTIFALSIGVWVSIRSQTRNGAFWKLFLIWVGLAFLITLLFQFIGLSVFRMLTGPSNDGFVLVGFLATFIPPFTQLLAASQRPDSRYYIDIVQIVISGVVSQSIVAYLAYHAAVAGFREQTRPEYQHPTL